MFQESREEDYWHIGLFFLTLATPVQTKTPSDEVFRFPDPQTQANSITLAAKCNIPRLIPSGYHSSTVSERQQGNSKATKTTNDRVAKEDMYACALPGKKPDVKYAGWYTLVRPSYYLWTLFAEYLIS